MTTNDWNIINAGAQLASAYEDRLDASLAAHILCAAACDETTPFHLECVENLAIARTEGGGEITEQIERRTTTKHATYDDALAAGNKAVAAFRKAHPAKPKPPEQPEGA